MRFTVIFFLTITISSSVFAQTRGASPVDRVMTLDRYIEYKDKNLSITSADGKTTYRSMLELDERLEKARSLYLDKQYKLAYPLIADLAQWGVKNAQMLLGDMFIHGHHVSKSTVRGLAWLGVAKEKGFEAQAEEIFQHVYQQLSSDQQRYIDTQVENYIAKFGFEAQQYRCKKVLTVGTNIRVTECQRRENSDSVLHPIP